LFDFVSQDLRVGISFLLQAKSLLLKKGAVSIPFQSMTVPQLALEIF